MSSAVPTLEKQMQEGPDILLAGKTSRPCEFQVQLQSLSKENKAENG